LASKRKILTVVGARPQFIKASPVSAALARVGMDEILVHTGQHYDANMSDVFFEELGIPAPKRHLGIGSGLHGAQTGAMLEALERTMLEERPDWVLVYGDTNSTLAGALSAAKLHIPVAHVEAGLRSFNRTMPEELNRLVTDHLASMLFTPTEGALELLRREGIEGQLVHYVGDVMYDAALHFAGKARSKSTIIERFGLAPGHYLLATIHRAENTDNPDRLIAIMDGLASVSETLSVLLPLHPRTRRILGEAGKLTNAAWKTLNVVDPVGYLDMVCLEQHAALIATDSGGVQKEAFFYQVPCVTLRTETEWTELVDMGWNRLVAPISPKAVEEGIRRALGTRGQEGSPYGDGKAAERIAKLLLEA